MVVFENPGELDILALKTFGVSVKEVENPIGFFGTGLKYAIAVLVRNGNRLTVDTGGVTYSFLPESKAIRGSNFQVIRMVNETEGTSEVLGFTTHLGANWSLWQAYRELHSNCLDEGGRVYSTDKTPIPFPGSTYITVHGSDFHDVYLRRSEIFLELPPELRIGIGKSPYGPEVEFWDKPSQHLYYRGIRVWTFPKTGLFTYNIVGKVELTEDRTLKDTHALSMYLPESVVFSASKSEVKKISLIRRILLASEESIENQWSWQRLCLMGSKPMEGNDFMDELKKLVSSNTDRLTSGARQLYMTFKNKNHSKELVTVELTRVQQIKLDNALEALCKEWPRYATYKVRIVENLGESTMGMADMDGREAVISIKAFDQGTKYLASTLLEEFVHLDTGLKDCTRGLQTHLFDTIVTMVEERRGVPL